MEQVFKGVEGRRTELDEFRPQQDLFGKVKPQRSLEIQSRSISLRECPGHKITEQGQNLASLVL